MALSAGSGCDVAMRKHPAATIAESLMRTPCGFRISLEAAQNPMVSSMEVADHDSLEPAASAASFSTYLRYSAKVSHRCSEFTAPEPVSACWPHRSRLRRRPRRPTWQFVDEADDLAVRFSDLFQDSFQASSNSPRNFVPHHLLRSIATSFCCATGRARRRAESAVQDLPLCSFAHTGSRSGPGVLGPRLNTCITRRISSSRR